MVRLSYVDRDEEGTAFVPDVLIDHSYLSEGRVEAQDRALAALRKLLTDVENKVLTSYLAGSSYDEIVATVNAWGFTRDNSRKSYKGRQGSVLDNKAVDNALWRIKAKAATVAIEF